MAMPVKAPPPPPPPPSWWSGFIELDWESFLINPQGQALIPHSTETLVTGINLSLYKDKTGFINDVNVGRLGLRWERLDYRLLGWFGRPHGQR